ncbi:importin-11-like [Ostrea edulis]|uniref:importin-11-like n=1 Tax=Ostrea edulis TaxID=37623 RepID=UPI0024AF29A5|nr:importin-11-like [Ostrea edulis]
MELSSAGPVVLKTLTNACSQNADVLKPAERQLQQWETQTGFYTVLSEIFCDHGIDVNVRWLAVLYCKNGVERYWRKMAPNAMSEEEKERLKSKLISNFSEPVPQIATQLAVLISKIARLDCPRNWNALLPALFQAVRCEDMLIQERALLILHHVTKTLASKRLAPDRKLFEDLTSEIFGFVYGLWIRDLDLFATLSLQHNEEMGPAMDRANLSCKIIRKQIAYGTKDPATNQDMSSFLNQIFVRLKEVLGFRQSMWGNHQVLEKCQKMILLITKILLDLSDIHPISFIQLIRPTLEFVVTFNFSMSEKGLVFQRFTVNCFNLMKGILSSDVYRPMKSPELTDSVKMEAYKIKMDFFQFGTLREICRRLVSQYFLLTSEDLSNWDSDPEGFCLEEGGDSFKYSLRPSSEVLYLTLFKEFRTSLIPVVLEMVEAVRAPCNPEDIIGILSKDAVYNAVGLSAFDLFDDVDFDGWFSTQLLQELNIKHQNYRILHRRIIWLCAQWVGVKMSFSLRPTLYQAIISLLNQSEDLVVRIESAMTLKTAVDDFEFNVEQFLPFLDSMFSLLFELLKEVQECDSKMQVLHVISFVIERTGGQIKPYASSLLRYLQTLWQEAQEHNMLKCAILTTLVHLVQGFRSTCTSMFDFLLPVIQFSTDVTQDQHVYLAEDGLDLWLETVRNSPSPNDHLLQLYRNMPGLLESGTETLRICLKIIEAYLLLCPQQFMHHFCNSLASSLHGLVSNIREDGQILILRVVELALELFPKEGPDIFLDMLVYVVKSVLEDKTQSMLTSMNLTLFGRVVLQNQEFLWKLLQQMALQYNQDVSSLFGVLLDIWFDNMDYITQPERRKLSALALASLLSVNSSVVESKFAGIVTVCVGVLHDVTRIPVDDDPLLQLDSLVISEADQASETDEEEVAHDKRKHQLSKQDPVHTVPLKDFLMSQLQSCQEQTGEKFDLLMEQVDPEIIQQLRTFTR